MQERTIVIECQNCTPKKMICNNCFHEMIGWVDNQGIIKVKCCYCGAITISKKKSRREVQINIIAPNGQKVI